MRRKATDVDIEARLGTNIDKSGGTHIPVHGHAAIEAAEARAFGRRKRKKPSPLVTKRHS
jgi:hypothetical protein